MTVTFGDILRATVQYTINSDEIHQNVISYQAGVGVSDTDANVIAAISTLLDTAYAQLNAIYSTDVSAGECLFAKLNQVSGKWESLGSVVMTQPAPLGTNNQMANGLAAVIRLFADGVGNQGRKFIGGFNQDAITDNTLLATPLAALVNFANILIFPATVSGGVMDPGWWSEADVLHRDYNGEYILNTIIGYQRRRKPGIGI